MHNDSTLKLQYFVYDYRNAFKLTQKYTTIYDNNNNIINIITYKIINYKTLYIKFTF